MQKQDYTLIGRRIAKLYPHLATAVLYLKQENLLSDYKHMQSISLIFGSFYKMPFPQGLKNLSDRESTQLRIKFTTLCMMCYDYESVQGKRLKYELRKHIANELNTGHCLVSQYVSKARVYLKAYPDFEAETV